MLNLIQISQLCVVAMRIFNRLAIYFFKIYYRQYISSRISLVEPLFHKYRRVCLPDFTGGFAETWGRASACRAIIRGVPRAGVSHRHGEICHCRVGGYQVTAGTHGTGEKYDKNNRAMDCDVYKLNNARVRILRRTVFVNLI